MTGPGQTEKSLSAPGDFLPPPGPLAAFADALIGLGEQLKRVDETDRLLLAMGDRLTLLQEHVVALERRLAPHPTPAESIELSVDPPYWGPDQPEADVVPPERPGEDYEGARRDDAAIEDLERRAREALPEGRPLPGGSP